METGQPDRMALESIRETEQALARRHVETQKKAEAVLAQARGRAEEILRRKEEELSQARRLSETMSPGSGHGALGMVPPPELDQATRRTAEKIASRLFGELIAGAPEEK